MADKLETCLNCEKQFDDSFEFCPYCGQKADDKLTFSVLFYNTISNYFSIDARFFKSFFPLLFKPGFLAKKFVEGKRLVYLHPARLYLFVSIVFFFLLSVTVVNNQVETIDERLKNATSSINKEKQDAQQVMDSINLDSLFNNEFIENDIPELDSVKAIESEINDNGENMADEYDDSIFGYYTGSIDSLTALGAPDSVILKSMGMEDDHHYLVKKFYKQGLKFHRQSDGGQLLQAIYDTIPIALFVLVPIFALLMKLFFFRRGRYAHHLVFSLYYFAFLFTTFIILILTNQVVDLPVSLFTLVAFSTFFYLVLAVRRFYQKGLFISFFKSSIVSFIYLLFVIPLAILIIGIVTFLFY